MTLTQQIRAMAARGLSDPQIADALGLGREAIRKHRARHGIAPGVRPGGQLADDGWEVAIRAAWERKLTTAQIAEETGYTVRTVQQRLHELGLRAIRP